MIPTQSLRTRVTITTTANKVHLRESKRLMKAVTHLSLIFNLDVLYLITHPQGHGIL